MVCAAAVVAGVVERMDAEAEGDAEVVGRLGNAAANAGKVSIMAAAATVETKWMAAAVACGAVVV